MWLEAWLLGEEERASLLWRRLPNDLILKILQIKRQERRVLKQYLARWLEYRALMKYLLKYLSKGASRSSPRYFDGARARHDVHGRLAAARQVRHAEALPIPVRVSGVCVCA